MRDPIKWCSQVMLPYANLTCNASEMHPFQQSCTSNPPINSNSNPPAPGNLENRSLQFVFGEILHSQQALPFPHLPPTVQSALAIAATTSQSVLTFADLVLQHSLQLRYSTWLCHHPPCERRDLSGWEIWVLMRPCWSFGGM